MLLSQLHRDIHQVQGWVVMDETSSGLDSPNQQLRVDLLENQLLDFLFGF